ncbi:MAG: MFS transporter [Candidatus Saccharimonadales bacterium]
MTSYTTSLRLLRVEIVATNTLASISIMVPFYHSIGMDQSQIGLSQALFTVALLTLNIPTGWIADRFSRKFCNAFGDSGAALGFIFYSQAHSFRDVIIAEIIIGISLAFSHGSDGALLYAYCQRFDSTGRRLRSENAMLTIYKPLAQIIVVLIGGAVAAVSPRTAILISAGPYVFGGILSLIIREDGERFVSIHRNPFRDMTHLTMVSLRDERLRWLIAAHAVGQKITHVMIWALTPLMLTAGVPLKIVAIGWALNAAMVAIGGVIARKWSMRLCEWKRFMWPNIVVLSALSVMSIHLSLITIWLYAGLGLAQGWLGSITMPMIQLHAPSTTQASVGSLAGSVSQLLYIPLVWIVGLVGVLDIRLTMVATILIFSPMVFIASRRLYTLESK